MVVLYAFKVIIYIYNLKQKHCCIQCIVQAFILSNCNANVRCMAIGYGNTLKFRHIYHVLAVNLTDDRLYCNYCDCNCYYYYYFMVSQKAGIFLNFVTPLYDDTERHSTYGAILKFVTKIK